MRTLILMVRAEDDTRIREFLKTFNEDCPETNGLSGSQESVQFEYQFYDSEETDRTPFRELYALLDTAFQVEGD